MKQLIKITYLIFFFSSIVFSQKENSFLNFKINKFDINNSEMEVSFEIINNTGLDFKAGEWELHWNQIRGFIDQKTLPNDIDFKWVNGEHYFILKFGKGWDLKAGSKISFSFVQEGIMDRLAMGPVGAFIVNKEKPYDILVNINWEKAIGLKNLNIPSAQERYKSYPDLVTIDNNKLNIVPTPFKVEGPFDYRFENPIWKINIDDRFKDYSNIIKQKINEFFIKKNKLESLDSSNFQVIKNEEIQEEAYILKIKKNIIEIQSSSYKGVLYSLQSLRQIISKLNNKIPIVTIKDNPRFKYRGFMLDIARNFYGPKKIKKVIDVMSLLKLNYLDLRLTDDEGWRLEIPGLPELTNVGSKRGFTRNEKNKLIPAYGSGAFGREKGNGFLNKQDFIEIIKYADQLGIIVIPQISFPSHARAAIKSMNVRYEKFISLKKYSEAEEYWLIDPNDVSKYRSAQGYYDNVICICRESAYRFFEKVVYEIYKMYQLAELKLIQFSIGADEMPYGSLKGAPMCKDLIKNEIEINNLDQLYEENLKKLQNILKKHEITMSGWEDILLDHSEKSQSETKIREENFNYEIIPYVWNNTWGEGREDMIYKFANLGFKTVMSNSSAFYFDMTDNKDIENYGLNWSGYVDYFDTWAIDPLDIFANQSLNLKHNLKKDYIEKKEKLNFKKRENFLGLQSQLWSETIISNSIFDELFFPNIAFFAEKAWSKKPNWINDLDLHIQRKKMKKDWNLFSNIIGQKFLPFISETYKKIQFDLPKPGGVIENNFLKLRSQFPGLTLRYSTDGSIPNNKSRKYKAPVQVFKDSLIVIRSFDSQGRGGRSIKLIK
ncbi:MAG: family 20 glycosylhydrolase [Flavobacteriaceae bacterium]|nr:family 20 glycosylhydrolase [Flavobacteriaceae bacterium]